MVAVSGWQQAGLRDENETERFWAWPFDAANQRVTADGQPVTKPTSLRGVRSLCGWTLAALCRSPTRERHARTVDPIASTTARRRCSAKARITSQPRLSRDGSLVAYRTVRRDTNSPERRLAWMARDGRAEGMLAQGIFNPLDWSADGTRILHNCPPPANGGALCSSPREATTTAESETHRRRSRSPVLAGALLTRRPLDPLQRAKPESAGVSVLGVMPSSGGKWTPLTDAKLWADKARWSPDGRTIYFISNRNGAFFDVWGIRFDPDSGRTIGEEFRVTRNRQSRPDRGGVRRLGAGCQQHAARAADRRGEGQRLAARQDRPLGSAPQ